MPDWITAKLAGAVALLLAVALAVAGFNLWLAHRDLAATVTRAEKAERDLGTARANVTTLESSLKEQGAALDQMGRDADAREAVRLAQDKAAAAILDKRLSALAAARPGPDKCASASDLIKEFGK